ncbi:MAG: hypothetical protein K0V04_04970 [Deltaproteobacteria bacterium]|nr:hypothetical protein [Deltaproteobacteria bacterium]
MNSAYIGFFVIGIMLVTIVPMIFMFRRVFGGMKRQQAETQRLLQVGTPASAQIISTRMGGMTITTGVHRHLQLIIQLQVHPPGRHPYNAELTTLISELQVPQLQPGAVVQVRIDPANPAKMALAGMGRTPAPAPQASPAAPRMQYGAGPAMGPGSAPGFTPVQPMQMPAGARVGMFVGIGAAIIGVLVTVAVVLVNVGGVGLDSEPDTSTVCGKAIACCETISASAGTSGNCKNLGKIGVPEQACQSSLEGFRQSAKAQGLTCE